MKLNHILLAALIGTMSAGCDTDVPLDQFDAASNEDMCLATGGYFEDNICICLDGLIENMDKYSKNGAGKLTNIPAIAKCDKGVACALNYESGQSTLVCAGKNKKLYNSFGIGFPCQDDIYENLKETMKGFFTLVIRNPKALDFEGTDFEFKENLKSTLLDTVAVPQKCINDEYGHGVISTCLGAYDLRKLDTPEVSINLKKVKGYLSNYRTILDNKSLAPEDQQPIEPFSVQVNGDNAVHKCENEDECKDRLLEIYSLLLQDLKAIFSKFTWQEPFQCPMNVSCKQTVRGLGECGDCLNDDTEDVKCQLHPNWVKVKSSYSELGAYALANDSFLGYCKNGRFEITETCVTGCDKGSTQCHTSDKIKGCSVDDKECLKNPHSYKYINVKDLTGENRTKVDGYKSGTTVCIKVDDNSYVGKLFLDANKVKKVVYSEQSKCPVSEECNSDRTFCKTNILSSINAYGCDKDSQNYKCVLGHDVTTERFSSIVFVCNSYAKNYSFFNSKGEMLGYQCPEGTVCGKNGSVNVEGNNVCVPK